MFRKYIFTVIQNYIYIYIYIHTHIIRYKLSAFHIILKFVFAEQNV